MGTQAAVLHAPTVCGSAVNLPRRACCSQDTLAFVSRLPSPLVHPPPPLGPRQAAPPPTPLCVCCAAGPATRFSLSRPHSPRSNTPFFPSLFKSFQTPRPPPLLQLDRHEDMLRSCLRCVDALAHVPGADSNPPFQVRASGRGPSDCPSEALHPCSPCCAPHTLPRPACCLHPAPPCTPTFAATTGRHRAPRCCAATGLFEKGGAGCAAAARAVRDHPAGAGRGRGRRAHGHVVIGGCSAV